MLRQSMTRRLEDLEEAAAIPRRVHFIFDEGQGQDEIEAEIASRIADGHAKDGDVFHTLSWQDWRPRDSSWVPTPRSERPMDGRWGDIGVGSVS
jgi:hypothetical protein